MLNIKVSTSSTGVEDANHFTYTFGINPADVDFQHGSEIVSIDTVHGAPSWQQSTWDGRLRTLTWFKVGATTTVTPSIKLQYDSMQSWVGEIRYFNFGDLTAINDAWPVQNDWKKTRIINLVGQIEPETTLRYRKLDLFVQPEQ